VGVGRDEVHVEDGSGLSRLNRATPSSFVRLLSYVAGSHYADPFWASLPEAGNRQELGRMYQSPAAANLRAKTGTISQVSALSGVVRAANGEPILFSIVSNSVPSTGAAKRIEDGIGIHLASLTTPWLQVPGVLARVEYGEHGPRLQSPVSETVPTAAALR
jgi:serine-type D-Ala-D-Ala carboxypeptidase/endopeptidase (penicillin-binding protein 4)